MQNHHWSPYTAFAMGVGETVVPNFPVDKMCENCGLCNENRVHYREYPIFMYLCFRCYYRASGRYCEETKQYKVTFK